MSWERRTAKLSAVILDHLEKGTLVTGEVACRCGVTLAGDRAYADHVAACVMDACHDLIETERIRGQIAALAAVSRYWQPSPPASSARSRNVYTGAQFAGWCRERAIALSRPLSGTGKPPTPDRMLP